MSEKSNKVSESMSSATTLQEASELLRKIAGPRQADESLKAVLRRVGRKLEKWSHSRIRAVWYEDKRTVVRADEVEQLRALANVDRRDRRKEDDELQELRATVARLAKYEALLERIDAQFFGPEISSASDHAGKARELLGSRGG